MLRMLTWSICWTNMRRTILFPRIPSDTNRQYRSSGSAPLAMYKSNHRTSVSAGGSVRYAERNGAAPLHKTIRGSSTAGVNKTTWIPLVFRPPIPVLSCGNVKKDTSGPAALRSNYGQPNARIVLLCLRLGQNWPMNGMQKIIQLG